MLVRRGLFRLPSTDSVISDLPPEFALVCACVIRPLSTERLTHIAALAVGDVDWDQVSRVAYRHRVSGLVRQGLGQAGLPVPARITSRATDMMKRALRYTAAARRIRDRLEQAGVPVLFLKGATLAVRAYGSIAVRDSADIDMVLAPEDLARAWQVLEEAGYEMIAPPRPLPPAALRLYQAIAKDSTHYHHGDKVKLELHWRMSDAAPDLKMPPPGEWQAVDIFSPGTLPTLRDVPLFLYLCVHGAVHGWSRLKWLADIAALLEASEDGGATYWAAAQEAGTTRPVASAIMLSNMVFGTALPPGFVAPRSIRLRALNAISLRVMTAGGGARELNETPWNSVVEPVAALLVISRWRGLWAQIRRVVIPAEDVVLLRLPAGLGFLYPILRLPLWLLKRSPWSPRLA